jgi:hypothetical protein
MRVDLTEISQAITVGERQNRPLVIDVAVARLLLDIAESLRVIATAQEQAFRVEPLVTWLNAGSDTASPVSPVSTGLPKKKPGRPPRGAQVKPASRASSGK